MRPSKLRLPERTLTATSEWSSIALLTSVGSGPELPMQVCSVADGLEAEGVEVLGEADCCSNR